MSFPESISHLFYSCEKVSLLWNSVSAWLNTHNIELPVDQNQILFGIQREQCNSVSNELIRYVKYFIWISKFDGKVMTLSLLQKFLRNMLQAKKDAFLIVGNRINLIIC